MEYRYLYRTAAVGALLAMIVNLLDVVLGLGEANIAIPETISALGWFDLFREHWFNGLYLLGVFNILYMLCMVPVYMAFVAVHRNTDLSLSLFGSIMFLLAFAIYASNNAAFPMLALSGKFATATTEAQQATLKAAGETILARGEDFTPGSFLGIILSGLAALMISWSILRAGIFTKTHAWVGIIGFTLLSVFTILATFAHNIYLVAYYGFGMTGGLFAFTWFFLTAHAFYKLAKVAQ